MKVYLLKNIENIAANGEIAPFVTMFSKLSAVEASESF